MRVLRTMNKKTGIKMWFHIVQIHAERPTHTYQHTKVSISANIFYHLTLFVVWPLSFKCQNSMSYAYNLCIKFWLWAAGRGRRTSLAWRHTALRNRAFLITHAADACIKVTITNTQRLEYLWPPNGIRQDIIFLTSGFFYLSFFFFFPCLISAVANWMYATLPHMVWP